jgi:EAL and modified HD-GYP domain-containing signal transduction protein
MYSSVSKIDSLSRAITYLGLNQIRSLTTLLALSSLSDKPNALKISTMVRAKMCELVGTQIGRQHTTTFFSLGLLSTLDAYFDQPLESLLNGFSLNEELTAALLSFTGTSGQVLQAVIALEQARWDDIDWTFLATHKISPEFFNEAYQTSIIWQASSALD